MSEDQELQPKRNGRPPKLSDEQRAWIIANRTAYSIATMANHLHVSKTTVSAVRREGK